MERPPQWTKKEARPRHEGRLLAERSRLEAAVRGKAGQWMAAAMLALSAQGCARIAEVAGDTTVQVDFSVQPPRPGEGGPSEGRVNVTAYERLSDDRLPLLEVNDFGQDVLMVERLGNRWMEEMQPGRSYVGSDGHRYVAVDFPTVGSSVEPSDLGTDRIEHAWSERLDIPFRVLRRGEREIQIRGDSEHRSYYLLRSIEPVTSDQGPQLTGL